MIGPFGFGNRNTDGGHLPDLCVRNNLIVKNTWFRKQDSHKITRYSWDGRWRTLIDYVVTDKEVGRLVTDVKVIPSESMDSDHRLVVTYMKNTAVIRVKTEKKQKIRVWELDKNDKRTEYQNRISQKLPKCATRSGDEEWKHFRDSLVNEAIEVCGKTSSRVKDKETPWWNGKVKQTISERNKMKKTLDKEKQKPDFARDEDRIRTLEQDYRDRKLKAKRIITEEKEKCWNEFAEKLENDCQGNMRLLYKVVKNKRYDLEAIRTIEKSDGSLARNVESIRVEMGQLLNGDTKNNVVKEQKSADVKEPGVEEAPLTWLEVEKALKSMKRGKSSGADELNADMIKASGVNGMHWLYRVLSAIWKDNSVPEHWSKGVIVPLFKKGNRKRCENYRGITLLSHGLKLMEKIIEKRLRIYIEPQLEEEQHGFRKERRTYRPHICH